MDLHYLFNGLFSRTTWANQQQKGKTSLDLNKARDDGLLAGQCRQLDICTQSAPHSRQISTPTPHHSGRLTMFSTYSNTAEYFII